MIKRYVGLDFIDLLIHAGVTGAVMVLLGSLAVPTEEAGVAIGFGLSMVALAWRRARALREAPASVSGEVPAERVMILEERVAELEAQQGRMLELEERLDFAERLLSRQREQPRLGMSDRP